MSNSTNNPIRVADLPESVYVPRVPARSVPPLFPTKKSNNSSHILGESNARYAWNSPVDEVELPASVPSAQAVVPPIVPTVSPTVSPLTSTLALPCPVSNDVAPSDNVASEPCWTLPATTDSPAGYDPTATEIPSQVAAICVENARGYDELCDLLSQPLHDPVALPKSPPSARVWGIGYHAITMDQTLDYLEQAIAARQNAYAITANLNYAMLCNKYPRLQAFTEKAALVLCDGMPALWRSKLGETKLPERVAGSDLIYRLCERCAQKRLTVYFYGAADGIAEKTAAKLKKLYPQLIVAGVQSPPFHESSSEHIRNQIARIRQANPDVLFVALGQPKGEYWIEDHLAELSVPLSIQVGASFDFVAGNAVRAPKWMQFLGLEWLFRTAKDPRRLAPRYYRNLLFLLRAIRREMIDSLS